MSAEVELAEDQLEAVDKEAVLAGVARGAAETIALLAEQRWTRAIPRRLSRERRIRRLARALDEAGPDALEVAVNAAANWLELGDPWALWPALYLLRRVDDHERIETVLATVEGTEQAAIAAEALAAVPGALLHASDWLGAKSPLIQGIGLEVLARHDALPASVLERSLAASEPAVITAALRALHAPKLEQVGTLVRLLEHSDGEVVDLAGRALLRARNELPLELLRARPEMARVLGARAVEWVVLGGRAQDLDLLLAIPRVAKPSRELLSALGRLGNPLVWSFLIHYVADTALGDAAQAALMTLFGDLVPPEERAEQNAWRGAIAKQPWDPSIRYRRGEPWLPKTVIAECMAGDLSAREVTYRLDELTARTRVSVRFDFAPFHGEVTEMLRAVLAPLQGASYRAGSWVG